MLPTAPFAIDSQAKATFKLTIAEWRIHEGCWTRSPQLRRSSRKGLDSEGKGRRRMPISMRNQPQISSAATGPINHSTKAHRLRKLTSSQISVERRMQQTL
jgi:hypothetical protein